MFSQKLLQLSECALTENMAFIYGLYCPLLAACSNGSRSDSFHWSESRKTGATGRENEICKYGVIKACILNTPPVRGSIVVVYAPTGL